MKDKHHLVALPDGQIKPPEQKLPFPQFSSDFGSPLSRRTPVGRRVLFRVPSRATCWCVPETLNMAHPCKVASNIYCARIMIPDLPLQYQSLGIGTDKDSPDRLFLLGTIRFSLL